MSWFNWIQRGNELMIIVPKDTNVEGAKIALSQSRRKAEKITGVKVKRVKIGTWGRFYDGDKK